ncbi:MAG: SanA/YdcF family protein [Baaleninema sp.]
MSFVYANWATRLYRFGDLENIESHPVAIVFGAGVWDDGTPTPMLADRVLAGVALYQRGTVEKLLMSGDNRSPDYNEVDAMRRYAEARGVPREDIWLDRLGLSTYDTCVRAQREFGIDRAVLVTQRYHLPRAVYIARHLGIDAVGFGVPDWGVYTRSSMVSYSLREIPATLKAMVQVSRRSSGETRSEET